ncbi:hypothetical protein L9F63_020344 [Diploptera punctata]|uniref:EF-hand domain-containing protein n=1 Tax=Diploptera punctata TaxID=6984 RepID=A0AAD7ZT65_DIPPU|nr:hypothetical protein L9F63_020344 [Diploptera punctata]
MAHELQLEQLFRACDKRGTGHIGPSEFRELCAGFEIDPIDSDVIFTDLDHDGDGQVSLEDFAWGFRDFLAPGSRRGSMQVGIDSHIRGEMSLTREEAIRRQAEMEKRHSQAKYAWSNLVASVGELNVHKFLNKRLGSRICAPVINNMLFRVIKCTLCNKKS